MAYTLMMKTLGSCILITKSIPRRDFLVQEGFLFKDTRLCILKCSTRELVIREVHGGSFAGHFGESLTLTMLREHYY